MSRYQHYLDTEQRTKVEQIVRGIQLAIREQRLAPGSKLPSIRALAADIGASPFTVSEAYDKLVQDGWLAARAGSGFYAQRKTGSSPAARRQLGDLPLDSDWLLSGIYRGEQQGVLAGCGWLPASWYDVDAQARALRKIAREQATEMTYGHPQGLPALRDHLAHKLSQQGLACSADDILLTQGATHALDIVCHTLRIDQSPVLVDNPGYCNLLSALRFRGCTLLGVDWTPTGPDLQQLEQLLQQYRPKVFFTNPWLHNPTGASYAPHIAHGVLRLAQQYGVLIVEDNVSADLMDKPGLSLAALDGLQQVIHIGSFSKALSPALRVGYLLASEKWLAALTRAKMLASLTSSAHTERLALELASDSKYKRQNARLVERIAQSTERAVAAFEQAGWQVFQPASRSMFVWAKPPAARQPDLEQARSQQIYLAPGGLFSSDGGESPYFRFNATYLDHAAFWKWLAQT